MKKKKVRKNVTKICTASCLEKVFSDRKPALLQTEYTAFRNEVFHYQVCCYTEKFVIDCKVSVESDLGRAVSVRTVEPVAARFAVYPNATDKYYIKGRGNDEMYPDLLRPVRNDGGETMRPFGWHVFWVTVDGTEGLPAGKHTIKVRVYGDTYKEFDKTAEFTLDIIDAELPESGLVCTNWMHYDGIYDRHGVEPFTDGFYAITAKYVESALAHGNTMLLTPIFTPSLDTGVGEYRKTVQLVKVFFDGEKYAFDFSEVKKFYEFALSLGVKYFELAHLCTQWGAKSCPKIEAEVNGERKRIFGWDVSATSEAYGQFLDEFFRAFAAFLRENGWAEISYFHISDESAIDASESFLFVWTRLKKHLPEAKTMDACGDAKFIEKGYLTHPVAGLGLAQKIGAKWVYYAGGDRTGLCTNRLFAMPLQRTRILGLQLYRNQATGFLHWGFNFYNCTLSHFALDPYFITDAAGYFDAGDSFVVYPAKDGVNESIRHEALRDGFQDYRAMKLLETLIGKEEALRWLDGEGVREGYRGKKKVYRPSAKWHLRLRARLNDKIREEIRRRK